MDKKDKIWRTHTKDKKNAQKDKRIPQKKMYKGYAHSIHVRGNKNGNKCLPFARFLFSVITENAN